MPIQNPAEIERIRQRQRREAIQRNAGTLGLGQGGLDYFSSSRDRFERYKKQLAGKQAPVDAAAVETDPTTRFIDSIRDLFPKPAAAVTPFDQSGFYNEADTKRLADQEYDPYYTREREHAGQLAGEEDRQRLEQINASGGLRSSAYDREMQMRREALRRAAEHSSNQQRVDKDQFLLNRRNEAYGRYLQSIGALTSN